MCKVNCCYGNKYCKSCKKSQREIICTEKSNAWRCYSTKDMVNWTDHGKVFSLDDISWADDRAWAPQAVERNGKFYLYCPVHKKDGGMAIAVGGSDSPTGPFKDLGHPLVDEGDWNDIDPTVFIDDDGQAYLYFGNPELRYVLLNEDMFYHTGELPGGHLFHRSVCVAEFTYNEDGTMNTITKCDGVYGV